MGGNENLTPAMRQYKYFKEKYPDCILLFRMGDFYEMFYDDAVTASKVLGITLTSRGKGDKKAPLAGIPIRAANSYLQKFILAGFKLAVAEQIEDPRTVKGRIVKRDVVRIITPGTILDEELLDSKKNNYICSIYPNREMFGLAFADISTGEFVCAKTNDIESLKNELAKIKPSECIIPITLMVNNELISILHDLNIYISEYEDFNFNTDYCYSILTEKFSTNSLNGFGIENENEMISASGALLKYIKETQKNALDNISGIRYMNINSYMMLDSSTLKNLEIFENIADKTSKNTLLSVLDSCITPMGSRLLRKWLERPLMDIKRINARLNAVAELNIKRLQSEKIRGILKNVYDIERIISRISFNNVLPKDLIAIKQTLKILPELKSIAQEFDSELMASIKGLPELDELREVIERAIKDNPSNKVNEGDIIKHGYNKELDELRELKNKSREILKDMENEEIRRTGIKTLKIGYNQVVGYFIYVSKSFISKVPSNYIKKQTLVNGERFITDELKELEARILGAEEKINILEFELFKEIVEKVKEKIRELQDIASRIALLDVLCSLSYTALKYHYSKPTLNESDSVLITKGRHPVVERIETNFIPNDTDIKKNEMIILTGPNMAGKSTYMRQICLIIIMAQIGSFVPAEEAEIGVVDRIFTRVGAYDDLAHGQSTFMVEMDETSNILNNATERSFIILDEVGRGTSTYDGVAIAWAVAEYIYKRIKAKTIFATHYHVLNKMANEFKNIKNYNIAVKEKGNEIIFLRKIIEGATDKSYGIHVAKIAGMPDEVIKRAEEIQKQLTESDEMIDKLKAKRDEKQFSLKKWER